MGILEKMAADLSQTEYYGRSLQGIIYVHRMADLRVGRILPQDFDSLGDIWGKQQLKNVVIVMYMAHEVKGKDVPDARERLLRESDICFKQVLLQNALLLRHDGHKKSAHTILRHIIKNRPTSIPTEDAEHSLSHPAFGSRALMG